MIDPSPEITAIVMQARQTDHALPRDLATVKLMTHVHGITCRVNEEFKDLLDDADCHDAATEALLASIRKFDPALCKPFKGLYNRILRRRMIDATRHKRTLARGSGHVVNLDSIAHQDGSPAICVADETDQQAAIDNALDGQQLLARVEAQLAPFEAEVYRLYLKGRTYRKIAEITGAAFKRLVKPKTIDNCLYRIKLRLTELAQETHHAV